jgi:RecA-family ATPase
MALSIARAVALEGEFLGWRGAGGRVLVIDAEPGLKTVKRRLREAGLEECEAIDYVRVPDGLSLDSNDEHAARVEALIAEGDYALVLADPLYKLHSGDSNDERQAVELMKRFDAWRERYGFALLLPVHLRKPPQNAKFSIHEFFGSSAYQRGAASACSACATATRAFTSSRTATAISRSGPPGGSSSTASRAFGVTRTTSSPS